MLLKDVSFQVPEENIVYDEVLLHLAEQGYSQEVLRFWESPEMFVVLGRICKEHDDVKMDAVLKDRIPVLRRCSGGGTVLQGRGCLNYSLILSKERDRRISDLRQSYQVILGKVIAALKELGVQAVFCPISDIALAGSRKKISGNAQKRARKFILHHGTILYDLDLTQMETYLNIPEDVPEYRRGRSHLDFVANVPLDVENIKDGLKKVFGVDHEEKYLRKQEKDSLQSLLHTKDVYIHRSGQPAGNFAYCG